MAQAYVPIQTYTLTSTASTIDFTNIPQNYTDLYIVLSGRSSRSAVNDVLYMKFNDSTSGYSSKILEGNGASATSYSGSSSAFTDIFGIPAASSTASTFGSVSIYIPNYTSSNNKSISVDGVGENNATTAYADLYAGLWSNSSAVTKITLYNIISTFTANTTATLYGVGGARASGGTITADSRYTYHTFTSTETFTALEKIKGAEVLVIAGGGGGGANRAGGGGAGGVAYGTPQLLNSGTSYTVVVGSGGAGGVAATSDSVNGSNSTFGSIPAIGGGGTGGVASSVGRAGGSGGGAQGAAAVSGGASNQTSGLNYIGYGNAGGNGVTSYNASGGGGGAGAAGQNGNTTTGQSGNGGIGTTLFSSWGYATSTGQSSGGVYYYAGGGGGGGSNDGSPSGATAGNGGLGGGGNGNKSGVGTAGTANTGGGGGGGSNLSAQNGGNGGSGLVIIRYPN